MVNGFIMMKDVGENILAVAASSYALHSIFKNQFTGSVLGAVIVGIPLSYTCLMLYNEPLNTKAESLSFSSVSLCMKALSCVLPESKIIGLALSIATPAASQIFADYVASSLRK